MGGVGWGELGGRMGPGQSAVRGGVQRKERGTRANRCGKGTGGLGCRAGQINGPREFLVVHAGRTGRGKSVAPNDARSYVLMSRVGGFLDRPQLSLRPRNDFSWTIC